MEYCILIVDDSSTMRKILLRNLHLCDFPISTVFEASNSQEGLDILDKNPQINFAFLDINMPIMDGEILFQKIRQHPHFNTILILFISSDSSTSRIERLLKQGAMFVHKPFTPETLQEALLQIQEKQIENNKYLQRLKSLSQKEKEYISEKLIAITGETLEKYCGLFFMKHSIPSDLDNKLELITQIKFSGPFKGSFLLLLYGEICGDLVSRMLGETTTSEKQRVDAIHEIASIICGNILPYLSSSEEIFDTYPSSVSQIFFSESSAFIPYLNTIFYLEKGHIQIQIRF